MGAVIAALMLAGTLAPPQGGFSGGEVSPTVPHAVPGAMRTIENMLVVGTGVATRRPGSVYVADTEGSAAARLMPFIYSESDAYVLEFTNTKLNFYRSNAQIAYDINTVYETADLFEIQAYQSADVMYLVQEDHPPQKLSRAGHSSWTIADVDFTDGPFLEEDDNEITLTTDDISGTIAITSDADVFNANHVGALWSLSGVSKAQTYGVRETSFLHSTYPFYATFDSATDVGRPMILGEGQEFTIELVSTSFKGKMQLRVLRDFNSVNYTYPWDLSGEEYEVDYEAESTTAQQWSLEYTDIAAWGETVLVQLACTEWTSGTLYGTMARKGAIYPGHVEITAYTSAKVVSATVKDELPPTDYDSGWYCETEYWSEGAWSDDEGYPTAISAQNGRVVYGKDMSLYFTGTDNYESMRAGELDDSAYWYSLSRARQDGIQWLLGERKNTLLVGTLGKVFEVGGSFIPSSPPTTQSTLYLSSYLHPPVEAGSAILLLDRSATQVYECGYSDNEGTYVGAALTYVAEHITEDGIVQMAWQETPYPCLWCVISDGTLATLYYNRAYKIAAWSRQVTDGDYTSVAVIPQASGPDQVWTVVKRTVDSNDLYYVEYFDDLAMGADLEDAYFVDSGTTFDGGAAVDVAGISKADPGVVTVSSWPTDMADGDQVYISGVAGMTEINNRVLTVDDADESGKTFSLDTLGDEDFTTASYTTYTSGGTVTIVENTFSLAHLEAEDVTVWADSTAYGTETVASDAVTLDDYYNHVAVGLPYTSTLATIPLGGVQDKVFRGLYIDVYCSSGGQYGVDADNLHDIRWPTTGQQTGSTMIQAFGGARRDSVYQVVQAAPAPLTVREMIPVIEVQQ